MEFDNFTNEFVAQALNKGVTNVDGIVRLAKERISEIDEEIAKAIELRKEKTKLSQVIRDLAPPQKSKHKPKEIITNKDISSIDNLKNNNLTFEIIDLFESNAEIFPTNLINLLGYGQSDPTPVYSAIKICIETGILKRQEDRSLARGPNWDNRNQAK